MKVKLFKEKKDLNVYAVRKLNSLKINEFEIRLLRKTGVKMAEYEFLTDENILVIKSPLIYKS